MKDSSQSTEIYSTCHDPSPHFHRQLQPLTTAVHRIPDPLHTRPRHGLAISLVMHLVISLCIDQDLLELFEIFQSRRLRTRLVWAIDLLPCRASAADSSSSLFLKQWLASSDEPFAPASRRYALPLLVPAWHVHALACASSHIVDVCRVTAALFIVGGGNHMRCRSDLRFRLMSSNCGCLDIDGTERLLERGDCVSGHTRVSLKGKTDRLVGRVVNMVHWFAL